jgi:hypothetical protein
MRTPTRLVGLLLLLLASCKDSEDGSSPLHQDAATGTDGSAPSSPDAPAGQDVSAPDAGEFNSAPPEPVMAVVGPNGGELRTGGLSLSIPAGALGAMTQVSVADADAPADELAAEPVTHVYEFSPSGLTFSKPVPIRMELTRELDASDGEPAIYWTNAEGEFERLPTRREGRILIAEVTLFSSGFGGVGLASACNRVSNCGQKLCLCFTDQNQRLCSKPNVDCNEEAPWAKAAEVGAECEAFEFLTANKVKGTTGLCSPVPGQPEFCEIKIPEGRYPEAAKHIADALSGFPEWLTLRRQDEAAKSARRNAARKKYLDQNDGKGAPLGYQIDEFPPAMTDEGGSRASVRAILAGDNWGAGGCMGAQVGKKGIGLPDGTPLKFVVIP